MERTVGTPVDADERESREGGGEGEEGPGVQGGGTLRVWRQSFSEGCWAEGSRGACVIASAG